MKDNERGSWMSMDSGPPKVTGYYWFCTGGEFGLRRTVICRVDVTIDLMVLGEFGYMSWFDAGLLYSHWHTSKLDPPRYV